MAINWNRKKYTEDRLREVVASSESWRQVARELGMNPNAGGIYYSIKAAVHELGLDVSHFTGQGWNKGDKLGLVRKNTIPLDEILVENSTYLSTSSLKLRLLKAGILESKCYAQYCPLSGGTVNPFTGEPAELKLALDHINGVRNDNRIENLRLLCYHCHGMTDTWCGKNKTSTGRPSGEPVDLGSASRDYPVVGSTPILCTDCKTKISKGSKRCVPCDHADRKNNRYTQPTKIDWPSHSELTDMVASSSYSAVGRALGVSDNAVRKRLAKGDSVMYN